MSIPSKPKATKDDFIKSAKATQADTSEPQGERGRPRGEEKKQLPVRLPVGLLDTIRKNCGGNMSYFTENVFRDYFERNNIKID